jgi:hypothetical protein
MSWAGIASNQGVSLNNLQDAVNTSVFVLKNTIPAGTKQITKAEADYYVYIETGYAPYAAKTSNQLVVKSDLVSSGIMYLLLRCDEQPWIPPLTYVTNNTYPPGTFVYNDRVTGDYILSPYTFIVFGEVPYQAPTIYSITNVISTGQVGCPTSTTTTTTTIVPPTTTTTTTTAPPPPVYYTYVVRPSNNLGTICTDPSYTVYSSSILLTNGDFIFYDTALTNPVTGFDYVVRASGSPDIYYMNPGTGELTSDTGIDC